MQTEAKCVTWCRGAAKCFVTSCLGGVGALRIESHLNSAHEPPSPTDINKHPFILCGMLKEKPGLIEMLQKWMDGKGSEGGAVQIGVTRAQPGNNVWHLERAEHTEGYAVVVPLWVVSCTFGL